MTKNTRTPSLALFLLFAASTTLAAAIPTPTPISAEAVLLPRETDRCCFNVIATNATGSAPVSEDATGALRIITGSESGTPESQLCVLGSLMTDYAGLNCSVAPATGQFACRAGAPLDTEKYTFDTSSHIAHDGDAQWLACPATGTGAGGGDGAGSFLIYEDAMPGNKTGCLSVELLAGGFSCAAMGSAPTSSSSSSAVATVSGVQTATPEPSTGSSSSSTTTATTTTTSITSATTLGTSAASSATSSTTAAASASCPANIGVTGTYQFPHLIVPVSAASPSHAFGNSYTAAISSANTTLFNFDVPAGAPYDAPDGDCALLFEFPYASQSDAAAAGSFYFSGVEEELGEHGGLRFALLGGVAAADTTYASMPPVAEELGTVQIIPGNNYTVSVGRCRPGQTLSYSVASVGGVQLRFFEDSAPEAIGLFIVPCA